MRTPALPVLAVTLAIGCTTQTSSDDTSGGGGKADDGTSTAAPLPEASEEEQSTMRAADAECLHIKYTGEGHGGTNTTMYEAAIKLFCLPRGGVAAPISMHVAAVALGESSALYKVYSIPEFVNDVTEAPTLRMVGDKAILSFKASFPAASEFEYETKTVTATLAFSGSVDDPTVTATYALQ